MLHWIQLQRAPAITSRFLCTILIESNVKKFGYNEHPPTTSSFFCIFLLVLSRTQCNWVQFLYNYQKISETEPRNARFPNATLDPKVITLGPAYNEFGYNEHPAITSRFLCTILIDSNVKRVRLQRAPTYNEQFLLHLFTRCKRNPV